ncbi:MAG TPA: hypothetical protein VFZ99_08910 [Terriglobales bacterium]
MKLPRSVSLLLVLFFAGSLVADTPDFLKNRPPMTKATRLQMIRLLEAELAYTRKIFPQGEKGLEIDTSGKMKPEPQELSLLIANQGTAARAGQRVQITDVEFKRHEIVFEINGGPQKKRKWYQRIEISGAGGVTAAPVDQAKLNSKGSYLSLVFPKYVPEMDLEELKKLLDPVLDFNAKSAAQAYMETLPPKVQKAIKNHEVLVGMNKDMVTETLGRPPKKVRERDNGVSYEEWIYGEAPADVQFVRFVGDEVVRVEVMPVGGEKILKTEKEIQINPQTGTTTMASAGAPPQSPNPEESAAARPAKTVSKKPTLRRPGEEPPPENSRIGTGPLPMPRDPDPGQAPSPNTNDPASGGPR